MVMCELLPSAGRVLADGQVLWKEPIHCYGRTLGKYIAEEFDTRPANPVVLGMIGV